MILRLPMQVRLFNEDGDVVEIINSAKKSQIRLRLHAFQREGWMYGTCRVWYNKPNDYWNEFVFRSYAQLEAGLIMVTEKPLIDFIHNEITPQYLEKRKPSATQLSTLRVARSKSGMGTK